MSTSDPTPAPLDPASEDYWKRLHLLGRYAQVGVCVNGVAHDINNLLGAAMAYAELISLDKNLAPEPKRMLGEVVNSTARCSKLVSILTAVARKDKLYPSITDPARIADSIECLVDYTFRSARIQFKIAVDTALPSMWCDASKLQHALLALLFNAMEAVKGTERAWITLEACRTDDRVEFVVSDSGLPIDEAIREAMFAPGFTTKQGDAHLGLGLSRASEIAALHAGDLQYDPERGFVLTIDARHLGKVAGES